MRTLILVIPLLLFNACSVQPQQIDFGNDQCSLCMMGIIDQKFGAEIVTKKGKIFKFDSGECMVNYLRKGKISEAEIHSLWIINTAQPKELIDASQAFYLHSENFPSPMGGYLSAFKTIDQLQQYKKQYGGDEWKWNDVMKEVR